MRNPTPDAYLSLRLAKTSLYASDSICWVRLSFLGPPEEEE